MDRYVRQRRLAELGEAGQARLLAANHRVAGTDGALTELVYLERAGFRAVSLDALAKPRPFAHAALFRHAGTRAHAAGAWRALRAVTELLGRASA
jgi:molybdopterin/thiamine biosynthesis adenylyltransferase